MIKLYIYPLVLSLSLFSPFSQAKILSWDWSDFSHTPDENYNTVEAMSLADRIMLFQRPTGGWPKRYEYDPDDEYTLAALQGFLSENAEDAVTFDQPTHYEFHSHRTSTFDNGATFSEIRYLLRIAAYYDGPVGHVKQAVINGLEYILSAQYSNGGWPQNYPNLGSYGGHITFNDNAMVGILKAIVETQEFNPSWISVELKDALQDSYLKGIDYILDSQIIIDGKRTGWAQQYVGYAPAQGRIYELPSISASETSDILKLLMGINSPSERVKNAVVSGVSWLDSVKIENKEWIKVPHTLGNPGDSDPILRNEDPAQLPTQHTFKYKDYDRALVDRVGAPYLWSRFYSLTTQQPIFSDWSGLTFDDFALIHYERRVAYSWYSDWAKYVIGSNWTNWKNEHIGNTTAIHSVSVSDGVSYPSSSSYANPVLIKATLPSGYIFSGWESDENTLNQLAEPNAWKNYIYMPDHSVTMTARGTFYNGVTSHVNSIDLSENLFLRPGSKLISGDMNGDGYTDYFVKNSDKFRALYLFNPLTLTLDTVFYGNSDGLYGTDFENLLTSDEAEMYPGDFNGDGKTDFFVKGYSTYRTLYLARTNGIGFTRVFMSKNDDEGTDSGGIDIEDFVTSKDAHIITGDYNGDGRTDLFIYFNDIRTLYLANENGNRFDKIFSSNDRRVAGTDISDFAINIPIDVHAGDYNADGKTDLFIRGSNRHRSLYLANDSGTGFVQVFSGSTDGVGGTDSELFFTSTSTRVLSGDFNGDGRTDLLALSPSGDRLQYNMSSTGMHFIRVYKYGPGVEGGLAENELFASATTEYSVRDFNGDGKADIFAQHVSGQMTKEGLYLSNSQGNGFVEAYYEERPSTIQSKLIGSFGSNGTVGWVIANEVSLEVRQVSVLDN